MGHLPLSKQKREGLGFGSIWNAFETHLGTGRARPAGCWPPRGGEQQLAPPAKPVVLVDGVKLVDSFFSGVPLAFSPASPFTGVPVSLFDPAPQGLATHIAPAALGRGAAVSSFVPCRAGSGVHCPQTAGAACANYGRMN